MFQIDVEGFGGRVRSMREARGVSVRMLARQAQVPHPTISRLENTKGREPSLKVAARLAVALGVSLDYLAGLYLPPAHDSEPRSP